MAQTLQNQITYAKSMNGIVTLSDGAGTTISNGTIDTDNLITDTMTSLNMISTNMVVPRVNTALISLLGADINLTTLSQNLNFNTTARQFELWNDQATGQILAIDVSNNVINISTVNMNIVTNTALNFASPSLTFTNSTVSFPNSTVSIPRTSTPALNTFLGSTINLNSLIQNLNFNTTARQFELWNDQATGQILTIDVSNNVINISTVNMNIVTNTALNFASPNLTFTNSTVSFPNSTVSIPRTSTPALNTFLGSTINVNTLLQNLNFNTTARQFELWNDQATGQILVVDVSNNVINISTVNMNIVTNTALNFSSPSLTFTNSAVSFPNSTVSFNSYLPTSTIASTTSATQFITRAIADGRYQQIANNIIYVRNVPTDNCFILGSGPATVGTGYNNFTAGGRAGESLTSGYNNFALGTVALLQCTTGYENTAIGAGALIACNGNGNTAIGYCGPNVSSGSYNTFVGKFCGGGVTTSNDNCCIGYFSFVSGSGSSNTCYGNYSGQSLTNGYNNLFLGFGANTSLGSINNAVAIGAGSTAQANFEFVLGTDNHIITLPNKTKLVSCQFPTGATINLSFRTNENVILQDATTTIINLPTPNVTDSRNVGCKFTIIRAVTSTNNITINAPSGQTIGQGQYSGTLSPAGSFLLRKGESQVSIVCIANSGMSYMVINTSLSQATDNLYISSVIPSPSSNYALTFGGLSSTDYYSQFSDTTNLNYKPSTQTLTAKNISSSGIITGNVSGNLTGTATTSTNATITDQTGVATTFYPTFVSATSGNLGINAGSNLQYRPDNQTLLLSSGVFEGYKSRATAFQYLTQETLITAATTLTNPLRSYYPFTMKTAAGYTITVPEVTALNVGTQLTFKRIGGSLQSLTLGMTANQPIFMLGTTQGNTVNQVIVGTTQSCATLVAIQSQDGGAGTFSNAAASTTITIVTQTSGTLTIGGIINCNGNVRYITAYGTGLGGTGTYIVNAAIAGANTNAAYTSSVTYGWSLTSAQ